MREYFDKMAGSWDQDPMKIERSKVTAEYCKKVPLKATKKLLDFGGGTGLLSLYLHDTFDHITIADSSKEMLKIAQEKIKKANISNINTLEINNDIAEIPGKYSAIIMQMTLHHISNVNDFLQKAANILDDSGVLMIADLFKEDGAFHRHHQDYNGHNGFAVEELSKQLESVGFKVLQATKYFEIKKEISQGEEQVFPLFFIAAEKYDSAVSVFKQIRKNHSTE